MPITIVVGGQFGSEGKGKVAHYLAQEMNASVAVRCGGTNSGHTVIGEDGTPQVFRQLPTAVILPDVHLALCAGSYIDVDILQEEIIRTKLEDGRLMIDPFAVIITDEHKISERSSGLISGIGSTGSGTGAAVTARIQRKQGLVFAKDAPTLSKYIQDVNTDLRRRLENKQRLVLEGTQGFGLSPLHSKMNPYVTSRDTTAAGFLSEVGLSPLDVDDIVMVLRAFPIRVGGNSGPLPSEIDWETVSGECNSKTNIREYTSVTKHLRRVARFDPDIVKEAIQANAPSRIFLNHLDYINADARSETLAAQAFAKTVSKGIGRSIDYLGLGPSCLDLLEAEQ